MKTVLIFVICVAFTLTIAAQDIRDGYHITNYSVIIKECNRAGTEVAPQNHQRLEANLKFKVLETLGANYIIHVLNFPASYSGGAALNTTFVETAAGAEKYFLMAIEDYNRNAERLQRLGKLVVGASTTLIKVRPGEKKLVNNYRVESEFGNDFNIGVSLAYRLSKRHSKAAHNFVGGISFTSIKVTPYSTKDFIDAESTQSCITASAGYIFEYEKFQIGAFMGLDMMSGEIGRNWIYRNRPWFGLGFGYQIFRDNENKKAEQKE